MLGAVQMLIKETVTGYQVIDSLLGVVLYTAKTYDGALQYCANNR